MLVGAALVMTWQGLALAGDGSYYLVRILGNADFFGPDPRILANVVRQTPVLLAAKAGMTDTHELTLIHGAGLLLIPALVWSVAVLRARADGVVFAAVALTAGLCVGTTWFFAISESVLAVPLTVLVAVLLWQPRSWSMVDSTLAVTGSAILIASYETAVLTGSILALWALSRGRRAAGVERYSCFVVAAASALSAVAAVAGVNAGPGPTNAQSFMYFVLSLDPWAFYVGLAGVIAVVVGLAFLEPSVARLALIGAGAALILVAILGRTIATPIAFEARGGAAIAALLLELFLYWRWRNDVGARSDEPSNRASGWYLALPVAVVAAMVATSLVAARSWSRDLDVFREAVNRSAGSQPAVDVLPSAHRRVLWDWTAASLSLVVRAGPDARVLFDRHASYVPFRPSEGRDQLPDVYTWRR